MTDKASKRAPCACKRCGKDITPDPPRRGASPLYCDDCNAYQVREYFRDYKRAQRAREVADFNAGKRPCAHCKGTGKTYTTPEGPDGDVREDVCDCKLSEREDANA